MFLCADLSNIFGPLFLTEEGPFPVSVLDYVPTNNDLEDEMRQPIFHIPMPELPGNLSILAMRGHTMGAIEDGWLLYYANGQTPPSDEINGKLCIVMTKDGRNLTRKVTKAWLPGRWDLHTVTGEQLVNQELEWAEPVLLIRPYVLSEEEKRLIAEADPI